MAHAFILNVVKSYGGALEVHAPIHSKQKHEPLDVGWLLCLDLMCVLPSNDYYKYLFRKTETNASEFPEYLKEMYLWFYMINVVFKTQPCCATLGVMVKYVRHVFEISK